MDKQELIKRRIKKARKTRMVNSAKKAKETYLNRKWLFKKSCIERLSIDKIAELCRVSYEEIWDAHKKLGIPIIIMMKNREEWHTWVSEHRDKLL